jgi:hypothetical protein
VTAPNRPAIDLGWTFHIPVKDPPWTARRHAWHCWSSRRCCPEPSANATGSPRAGFFPGMPEDRRAEKLTELDQVITRARAAIGQFAERARDPETVADEQAGCPLSGASTSRTCSPPAG